MSKKTFETSLKNAGITETTIEILIKEGFTDTSELKDFTYDMLKELKINAPQAMKLAKEFGGSTTHTENSNDSQAGLKAIADGLVAGLKGDKELKDMKFEELLNVGISAKENSDTDLAEAVITEITSRILGFNPGTKVVEMSKKVIDVKKTASNLSTLKKGGNLVLGAGRITLEEALGCEQWLIVVPTTGQAKIGGISDNQLDWSVISDERNQFWQWLVQENDAIIQGKNEFEAYDLLTAEKLTGSFALKFKIFEESVPAAERRPVKVKASGKQTAYSFPSKNSGNDDFYTLLHEESQNTNPKYGKIAEKMINSGKYASSVTFLVQVKTGQLREPYNTTLNKLLSIVNNTGSTNWEDQLKNAEKNGTLLKKLIDDMLQNQSIKSRFENKLNSVAGYISYDNTNANGYVVNELKQIIGLVNYKGTGPGGRD